MRNSLCCCGCSLRTGILILLWLDLISQVLWITRFALIAVHLMPHLDVKVMYSESALLGWSCIILVTIICGIVGVEKRRPSYLLPYIGRNLLTLVVFALCTIGAVGFIVMADQSIEGIHSQESHEYIRFTYNLVVCAIFVNLVLFSPSVLYFFYVVCNYHEYMKMQEEDKAISNVAVGTSIVCTKDQLTVLPI